MALNRVSRGQTPAQNDAAINAAIGEAEKVAALATDVAARALAGDLDAEEAARTSDVASLLARILRINAGLYPALRPGDNPNGFSGSFAGGDPDERAPLGDADYPLTVVGDGLGRDLFATRDIWERTLHPVEPGTVWRARWRYVRRVDSADPSNDSVVRFIAWYGPHRNYLGATTLDNDAPRVSDGVREFASVIASSGVPGATAPLSGAAYFRVGIRAYGLEQRTAVTDVGAVDLSAAFAVILSLIPADSVPNLTKAIADEVARAKAAEKDIADDLGDEVERATAAEKVLSDAVDERGRLLLAGGATTAFGDADGRIGIEVDSDGRIRGVVADLNQPALAGGAVNAIADAFGASPFHIDSTGLLHATLADVGQPAFAGGAAFAVCDAEGNIGFGVMPDGTLVNSLAAVAYPVSDAYGTDLAVATDTGSARLTYDDGANTGPALSGNAVTYARTAGGATRRKSVPLASAITRGAGVTGIRMWLGLGQSLALGTIPGAPVALTTTPVSPGRTLAFASGFRLFEGAVTMPDSAVVSIGPGVEAVRSVSGDDYGETPMSGMISRLTRPDAYPATDAILGAIAAVGGTPYTGLKRGTVPWRNGIRAVLSAARQAVMQGLAVTIDGATLTHGEADDGLGTTQAQYLAFLLEWHADFTAAARAITGQPTDPVIVLTQDSSWGITGNPGPALAQLQACVDYPTKFVFAGPKYQLPYVDNRHLNAPGYRTLGELYGVAAQRRLFGGAGAVPALYPLQASRSGATITVNCAVPVAPLVIDTTRVTDPGNLGVRFVQAGGNSVSVSGVSVSGTQVTVTLSAVPTGTGQRVTFALPTELVGPNPTTGARCCIRDSTALTGIDGGTLSSWMPHASVPVA